MLKLPKSNLVSRMLGVKRSFGHAQNTAGSMDVERKVKPIKHKILSKERNALSDGKAIVLFRARENLKHLMKVKTDFKKVASRTAARPGVVDLTADHN